MKRGSFARDIRTNQIVKVAEIGGRDVMVRPAYRSDGYWTDPAHLDPARDPHAWTGRHIGWMVVALLVAVLVSWGVYSDLRELGLSGGDAVWYTLAPGTLTLWCMSHLTGLTRD